MSSPHRKTQLGDTLTDKQAAVLAWMTEFHSENMTMPTVREINAHFGFSQMGAVCHIKALMAKGKLRQLGKGKSRGYVLVKGGTA